MSRCAILGPYGASMINVLHRQNAYLIKVTPPLRARLFGVQYPCFATTAALPKPTRKKEYQPGATRGEEKRLPVPGQGSGEFEASTGTVLKEGTEFSSFNVH